MAMREVQCPDPACEHVFEVGEDDLESWLLCPECGKGLVASGVRTLLRSRPDEDEQDAAWDESVSSQTAGDLIAGRYRIERLLGEGGMGQVWLASDTSLHDRPVAIKRMLRGTHDEESLRRFESEIKVMSKLMHAHIVAVTDSGSDEQGFYFVMEYLPSESLRAWLRRQADSGAPPDLGEVSRIFCQIARGVAFAHGKGIVHRDLKPENVLIGEDGTIKVLDFGLARIVEDSGFSRSNQRLGTPMYMSPEQCRGAPCDARSDVYALGVMLFELCTLEWPFPGTNYMLVMYQHQNTDPPVPKTYRKDLPDRLDLAILRALEKNPAERFQSVKEFMVQIEVPLGTPQSAGALEGDDPETLAERARRLRRRAQEGDPDSTQPAPHDKTADALWESLVEHLDQEAFEEAHKTAALMLRHNPEDSAARDLMTLIGEELTRADREECIVPIPDAGLGIEFVWVPPGTFTMGSPTSEMDRHENETQHDVTLSRGFWLGKYPVTQGQWEAVMGKNPSRFKGDARLPVEQVSFDNCERFLAVLCAMRLGRYSLPTEAQWEYACRAGSTWTFSFGNDEAALGEYAWYKANSDDGLHPVGEKRPNDWGLHDMHGNVAEWCRDWHGPLTAGPVSDPAGPDGELTRGSRSLRVVRGGCWCDLPWACRSAYRGGGRTAVGGSVLGLRLVKEK